MVWLLKNMLTLWWTVPALTGLISLLINKRSYRLKKSIGITGAGLALIGVCLVWFFYPEQGDLIFKTNLSWISNIKAFYSIGIDQVSFHLILVTAIISFIVQITLSRNDVDEKGEVFLFLESLLILMLIALDGFLFIIAFIVYQFFAYLLLSNKSNAKCLIINLIAAFCVMITFIYLMVVSVGSFNFIQWLSFHYPLVHQKILFVMLGLAFFVQMKIWPFSSIFRDVFEEKPIKSSILSVFGLFLGFYGLYRLSNTLFPQALFSYSAYISWYGVIVFIYSIVTMLSAVDHKATQRTLTSVFASLILVGLGALNGISFSASVIILINIALLMIAHALVVEKASRWCNIVLSLLMIGVPLSGTFAGYYLLVGGLLQSNSHIAMIVLFGLLLFIGIYVRKILVFVRSDADKKIGAARVISMCIVIAFIVYQGVLPSKTINKIERSRAYYLGLINRNK